jgi:hypothetical protein
MEDGHLRKDCFVWKHVYEKNARNAKTKVGVNVVMVEWNKPLVNVCVMMRSKNALLLVDNLGKKGMSPTCGQRVKWDKKRRVHRDVIEEL